MSSKRKDSPYRSGRSSDWLKNEDRGCAGSGAGGGRGLGPPLTVPTRQHTREAALLTSACPPAIAYNRVGTGCRSPSAVPSSSNFPASHIGRPMFLPARPVSTVTKAYAASCGRPGRRSVQPRGSTRRRGLHKLVELGSACQPKIRRTRHVSIVKSWTGFLTLHASGRGISTIPEALTRGEEDDWGRRGRR